MKREALLKYIQEYFKCEPEYLWTKFPSYAVLRHKDTKKWFAVIMNVTGSKLGLKTDKEVDILNVKVRPEHTGSLRMMEGILPAYHMNKEHWISLLISEPLLKEVIYELLIDSYELTS